MMVKRVFLIYLRPNIAFLPINFGTTDVFQVLVAEKEIFEAPNFFSLCRKKKHSSLLSCFKLLNLGEWSLEFCWLKGFFQRLHQKRLPLCWASQKKWSPCSFCNSKDFKTKIFFWGEWWFTTVQQGLDGICLSRFFGGWILIFSLLSIRYTSMILQTIFHGSTRSGCYLS